MSNQINFNELIQMNINELNNDQLKFIENHNLIIRFANNSIEQLMLMAEALECMRDSKTYIYGGFKTFKDYVETALGIKERQAYNYIKVYHEFSKEFLHSNAKLGITKLSLLSTVSNEDREEILETTNVEDISVRELKEKIKELENSNKSLEKNIEQLELKLDNNFNDHKITDGVVFELEIQKEQLLAQIEELKNQPVKEIVKEVQIGSDVLEETKRLLEEKEKEIDLLNKKIILNDNTMNKFKIKFEDFQRISSEMFNVLNSLDYENKLKCNKAILAVVNGWNI